MGTVSYTPSGYSFKIQSELRAYLTDFDNAMISAGLTRAADTGQLDTSTVVPATQGVSPYYYTFLPLIYKWAGVNGYPDLYIRVAFHVSDITSAASEPIVSAIVAIGTSTNGVGSLSGNIIHSQPLAHNVNYGEQGNAVRAAAVVSVNESYISVCVDPRGRYPNTKYCAWAAPFFCLERQKNGDFHTTLFKVNNALWSYESLQSFGITSCINGNVLTYADACAWSGVDNIVNGQQVIHKFYRYDRGGIAEFMPLIAVHTDNGIWSSIETNTNGESRYYTTLNKFVGARCTQVNQVSSDVIWIPAMRVA